MAIPGSSDGQEVLRRGTVHLLSNAATSLDFDGTVSAAGTSNTTVPAHHIITMLSMVWNDQSNGAELINLYMVNGGNNHYILYQQDLAAYGTFIFNEKFVLIGGDALLTICASSTDVDLWYSYLDQDWS